MKLQFVDLVCVCVSSKLVLAHVRVVLEPFWSVSMLILLVFTFIDVKKEKKEVLYVKRGLI